MVRIPVPLEQKGRVWSDEGNVVVAQRGFGLQQRRLPQPWPGFAFTRSSLEFPDGLKEPGRAAKVKIARSQRRSRARPGCPCTELAPLRGPMAERCGPGRRESHEEDDRKVRRREKNRVAAQRSRKKQTQKADKLHECKRRRTGIPFVCFGMLPQQQCFVVGRALGVSISAAVAVAEALQPWSFSTGFSQ
ncbi:basic leucine zipper transcriptional factor ATF-like 3 isoform X2 [Neopsephotus bourkii]|uniref:basic leucine zipper transcriptional factor ATF-like 3 isoform X2 n=1 Tax=Neopsephotus bourkii TaxID=309878 RepID=UPI002AA57EBF|nr:basic leucine zipper transcriptional factor ATF-like 3 isoform X2 [Neopsephotus bourkii]